MIFSYCFSLLPLYTINLSTHLSLYVSLHIYISFFFFLTLSLFFFFYPFFIKFTSPLAIYGEFTLSWFLRLFLYFAQHRKIKIIALGVHLEYKEKQYKWEKAQSLITSGREKKRYNIKLNVLVFRLY